MEDGSSVLNIRNEAGECKGPHSCPRDTGPSHGAPRDRALDNMAPADSLAPPGDISLPDGMALDIEAPPDGMDLDNEAPPGEMDLSHEASHDGRREEAPSRVSEVKGAWAGMEAQSQPPLNKRK